LRKENEDASATPKMEWPSEEEEKSLFSVSNGKRGGKTDTGGGKKRGKTANPLSHDVRKRKEGKKA